jgi:hypothetical protein
MCDALAATSAPPGHLSKYSLLAQVGIVHAGVDPRLSQINSQLIAQRVAWHPLTYVSVAAP